MRLGNSADRGEYSPEYASLPMGFTPLNRGGTVVLLRAIQHLFYGDHMLKTRSIVLAAVSAAMLFTLTTASFAARKGQAKFTVRIENISEKGGLTAADGTKYPFALSPGFFAVAGGDVSFFAAGKKAGKGIEPQAEDGSPGELSSLVIGRGSDGHFGIFDTPVGGSMASPLLPGNSFEFTFDATSGMKFNLIAMYGQSNDLFYAPMSALELFSKGGDAISGDITDKFQLWDAGTEVNQAPGIGPDQAPRQKMKNTGTAENGVVHLVNDGFSYPNIKDVLRITITPVGGTAKSKKARNAETVGAN